MTTPNAPGSQGDQGPEGQGWPGAGQPPPPDFSKDSYPPAPAGGYPPPGGAQPPPGGGYPPPGGQPGYPPPAQGGYPGQQPGYPPYPGGAGYPTGPGAVHPVTGLPMSDKSKIVAGILQLTLGIFGAGRWYTGHTGMALGMLFTCGGLGIWSLIDGIMILVKGGTDAKGRQLRDS